MFGFLFGWNSNKGNKGKKVTPVTSNGGNVAEVPPRPAGEALLRKAVEQNKKGWEMAREAGEPEYFALSISDAEGNIHRDGAMYFDSSFVMSRLLDQCVRKLQAGEMIVCRPVLRTDADYEYASKTRLTAAMFTADAAAKLDRQLEQLHTRGR